MAGAAPFRIDPEAMMRVAQSIAGRSGWGLE